jgi:signal transduction histidine kinase
MLVEEEVAKSREKDRVMLVQSKQAAMGEMIGNIAHQWRQPLNDIGLYVQNIQDKYEYGELSEDALGHTVEKTMDKLEYMSQTIDDFRNFFRADKDKMRFLLKDSIDKTLSLTEAGFKNNFIEINLYLQDNIYITGYPNEFSQAVLNILNNAKDILVDRKIENPQVKINLIKNDKKITLTILDNAGGINKEIIDIIFEPYYTTKGKLTGTGLGLYISKTIIERNMAGRLSVKNIEGGAEFKIELENEKEKNNKTG